jgi:hypothetical protein
MKRADLIAKLEQLPADELAALASVTLKRGRPSNALRQALIDEILSAITERRLSVKRDGTITRRR